MYITHHFITISDMEKSNEHNNPPAPTESQVQTLVTTLTLLGDHQHLKRERALQKLQAVLKENQEGQQADGEAISLAFFKLMFNSTRWEDRSGAINGSLAFIEHGQGASRSAAMEEYMWSCILEERLPTLLADEEFRVRNQTATLLKAIILTDRTGKGIANFDKVKELLL